VEYKISRYEHFICRKIDTAYPFKANQKYTTAVSFMSNIKSAEMPTGNC